MTPRTTFHSTASEFLYNRYIAGDPQREEEYEAEVINTEIARKAYELRTKAGLAQQQLAERVGITASAISRLEDADYEGHSLSLLTMWGGSVTRGGRARPPTELTHPPRLPSRTNALLDAGDSLTHKAASRRHPLAASRNARPQV